MRMSRNVDIARVCVGWSESIYDIILGEWDGKIVCGVEIDVLWPSHQKNQPN
jgi:hypothetical protein